MRWLEAADFKDVVINLVTKCQQQREYVHLEAISKVCHQDKTAYDADERPKGREQSFAPDFQPPIVLQPCERALHLPTALVNQGRLSKRAALFGLLPRLALKMRNNRTDTTPFEPVPKRLAVKGFVGDDLARTGFRSAPFMYNPYALQRFFCQRDFVRRSTRYHQTDR